MRIVTPITCIAALLHLVSLFPPGLANAANEPKKHVYEDDEVYMRLVIRNKEQLSAFYVGRQFPKESIEEILKTCFITPIVKNKKFDALWVEPDTWNFTNEDASIERITRGYWSHVWDEINMPIAHRATFGWTLMPEARDLRFDESVGGSIVIPAQEKSFTLKARFHTGFDKKGKPKVLTFEDIQCSE